MRHLLIACALLSTACAAPEARADAIQANPEALNACVANAGADGAALERCRGAVARPCIEAEGAGTISDVLCWSEEQTAWQALVVSVSARIEASDAEKGARLRSANETWSAWLDAECAYRAYEFGGGAGEQVDHVRCAADLTADRVIGLLSAR